MRRLIKSQYEGAKFADNDKNKPDDFVPRHASDENWHMIMVVNSIMVGLALLICYGIMYVSFIAILAVQP